VTYFNSSYQRLLGKKPQAEPAGIFAESKRPVPTE